jgi:hypothetical protein
MLVRVIKKMTPINPLQTIKQTYRDAGLGTGSIGLPTRSPVHKP